MYVGPIGQLLLFIIFLCIWTVFSVVSIVTYIYSAKADRSQSLLFYKLLAFLLSAGSIVFFFKFFKVDFTVPLFFIAVISTGILGYLFINRAGFGWWEKLNATYSSAAGRGFIAVAVCLVCAAVFGLAVFLFVRSL